MDETALNNGERQVAPSIDGIRRDHVARYQFAASQIGAKAKVFDFACGIGYGAKLLANAGAEVFALDKSSEAIGYAWKNYSDVNVFYFAASDAQITNVKETFDVAVCFETIEHLEDPLAALRQLHRLAPILIASVPNEEVFPHGGRIKFHHRHYTREQFRDLLESAGYVVTGWYGQEGPESEVEEGVNGRTIVVTAKRAEPGDVSAPIPTSDVPRHVVILGMGPSLELYVDTVKRLGGRKAFSDEVWSINALGDIIQCDRVFQMDDLRVQEARANANPNSNIDWMVRWLKRHQGPVYTSRLYPEYPGLVAYPLEDVVNSTGQAYFNSTAAYAVAYAIHLGVKKISLFGCDFTYPNAHHAEKGRACVEFWLGLATAQGIEIGVPENSSLLDMIEGHDAHFYGYDAVTVGLEDAEDGGTKITFTEREIPTAEEVERRYDHSRHPNAHVRG